MWFILISIRIPEKESPITSDSNNDHEKKLKTELFLCFLVSFLLPRLESSGTAPEILKEDTLIFFGTSWKNAMYYRIPLCARWKQGYRMY